jgi:hypothetical protein
MQNITTTRRARKPRRLRGYQITGLTKKYERIDSGLLWLPSPPLQLWQGIVSDANTYCATLIQSGRTLLKHEPWREAALSAPLNGNRPFSLMR